MRNQLRPVRRLARAAEAFGRGQDVERFRPRGAEEVRRASQAFLVMKERIRRQIEQRTTMLAGVSHDLRTPLTRMRLQLALLSSEADRKALAGDLDEMEAMVEGYLTFARGEGREATKALDLQSLLQDVLSSHPHAEQICLHGFNKAPMSLYGREGALKRAFGNVLSNALKYGERAWLTISAAPRSFEVSIEDDGPGIDPIYYEDVFKPFKRLEPSRNRETGGVGLGLAITRDVIMGHGGGIRLEKSANHGGLKVIIRLPKSD